ncbi:FBP domain-containing protein [Agromyces protaetiae]|uniref:FBP domain-containing protein n=1 Tax=Agromyces protaetiae TaxID=2509455 RepID=A0A4P6F9B6_9MICO|nr:FBP domain-containing protein [Agromyces protaetiae]QAY72472.1 FBP domain-containing protein [Agromyces protaetiae]
MHPITDAAIRASLVNATKRERTDLTLPKGFADLDFDRLDFLGWRDPKLPRQAYVVAEIDGEFVGAVLRLAEGKTRTRPQCSWCEDVHLPNDVVFYTAKRAGDAGRKGDTIGTLVCADFECSRNVRKLPAMAYTGFDREAARDRRVEALREHVTSFVRDIRDGG